jgi:predicted aspartyl protease
MFLLTLQLSGVRSGVLPADSEQNKPQAQIEAQKPSATVPLFIENNRPFIDIEFIRPDGSTRKARFWVDTGGGGFIIVEPLARELGLKFGTVMSEGGSKFASTEPPVARIGGMPLDLDKANTIIAIGQSSMMPGIPAEGLLPGHVLMRYHVVFDYPGRKFVIAKSGTIKPRGSQLLSPINQRSGFPRIEAKIGDHSYGFLLDTGASFTMVSQEVLTKWGAEHPDWPRVKGAVGAANMGLGSMEVNGLMLRIPRAEISTFQLSGAAAVSRPKGTFEDYMSKMMSAPIIGAIGGNILKTFRIEIDYANGVTYLEKTAPQESHDLDVVGLILQAKWDGAYIVAGISDQTNNEIRDAVRGGDRLIKVDSLEVTGAAFARVIDALRGAPGQRRLLLLERDGKRFELRAPIIRVL